MRALFLRRCSIALAFVAGFGACGGGQLRAGARVPNDAPTVIPFEVGCEGPSDAISLTGVEVEGNRLRIAFEHGGGCEEHSYRICASERVTTGVPGEWVVSVLHDDGGDACRALYRGVLESVLPDDSPTVVGVREPRANVFTLEVN